MATDQHRCECGAPKKARARRCRPCSNRATGASRRFLNHNCIDCGKRIAKGARRCRPCHIANNIGPNNPRWRGGRYVGKNGYAYVNPRYSVDPAFSAALRFHVGVNQIAEHILVMEVQLGRKLRKGETVHHRNGIRDDNRMRNLELWVKPQPAGQRVVDVVAWAREIIATYEPELAQIEAFESQTTAA